MPKRRAATRKGTERERKFLVDRMPPNRARYPHDVIRQGYITTGGPDGRGAEVRLRRTGGRAVLTVKKGRGTSREETEVALPAAAARMLWPLTRGLRLEKVRYRIPHGRLTIELDVYRGAARGLAVAEVEFQSDDALRRFEAPEWFGREVTGKKQFANSHLAAVGWKGRGRPR